MKYFENISELRRRKSEIFIGISRLKICIWFVIPAGNPDVNLSMRISNTMFRFLRDGKAHKNLKNLCFFSDVL